MPVTFRQFMASSAKTLTSFSDAQKPVSHNGFSISYAGSQISRVLKYLATPFKSLWNRLCMPASPARENRATQMSTPTTATAPAPVLVESQDFRARAAELKKNSDLISAYIDRLKSKAP